MSNRNGNPVAQITKLCTAAEKQIRDGAKSITQIDMKGLDKLANDLATLPAAVAACRSNNAVDLKTLTAALTPLSTALAAFATELTGPVGTAAAAAAARDNKACQALNPALFLLSSSFLPYLNALKALNLEEAKSGEIPKGVVAALMAPCPLGPAAFPIILKALGDAGPAMLANTPTSDGVLESYLFVARELSRVMAVADKAAYIASLSYYFDASYQTELFGLRKSGFTNKNMHKNVLKWATDAVAVATAIDTALIGRPDLNNARKELLVGHTCDVYLLLLGNYVSTLRDGAEMAQAMPSPHTLLSIEDTRERIYQLWTISGFTSAYLAALELGCTPLETSAGALDTRSSIYNTASGSFYLSLGLLWYDERKAVKDKNATVRANVTALLTPNTWSRMVAAAEALYTSAMKLDTSKDHMNARIRLDALATTCILALTALDLSAHKSEESLDATLGVTALGVVAKAWNSDALLMQPGNTGTWERNLSAVCSTLARIGEFMGAIPATPIRDSISGSPEPAELQKALESDIEVLDNLANMVGSIFSTLEAVSGMRIAEVAQVAQQLPMCLHWVFGVVQMRMMHYKEAVDVQGLNAVVPPLMKALHATLATARAYTTAPWAAWMANASGRMLPAIVLQGLPSVLVAVAGGIVFELMKSKLDVNHTELAGLALDMLATFDAVCRANPECFSRAQMEAMLYDYCPRLRNSLPWTPFMYVSGVLRAGEFARLERYITGPEPGAAALAAAVERCMDHPTIPPDNFMAAAVSLEDIMDAVVLPASKSAHRRRALALATLPCSCLGCTRTRRPGEKQQPASKCSGCMTAAYCGPFCQKKAWKQHKIGCKAIAAGDNAEDVEEEEVPMRGMSGIIASVGGQIVPPSKTETVTLGDGSEIKVQTFTLENFVKPDGGGDGARGGGGGGAFFLDTSGLSS